MPDLKINPVPVKYHVNIQREGWCDYWIFLNRDKWLISCLEDDKFLSFQNIFYGFENGFESEKEAFFILELYINKKHDDLVFYGNINRDKTNDR